MKVVCGLGGDRADLLVAAGISGDEEDWDAAQLSVLLLETRSRVNGWMKHVQSRRLTFLSSSTVCSR